MFVLVETPTTEIMASSTAFVTHSVICFERPSIPSRNRFTESVIFFTDGSLLYTLNPSNYGEKAKIEAELKICKRTKAKIKMAETKID